MVQRHQRSGKMPAMTRDHLALKFRQNWMTKYPLDTCSNGGTNLDDSLTSLNWLQNLNIMKITSPTPPPSPGPPSSASTNGDINKNNIKVNPNAVLNVSCSPPLCKMEPKFHMADPAPTTLGGDSIDYKTNPYVKPSYSYATLICMAMKETKKSKITLSSIYNWITDNFMYYRLADPSWQNSIRHNLSLNKCFQKVPRRKDEPGKGGFWRINPEYTDMIDNGIFKKRRNSRDSGSMVPSPKKIKKEEDLSYSCNNNKRKPGNSVVHFGNHEDEAFKGDFNWTSLLNQDIDIGGVRVKTEQILDTADDDGPLVATSPPSSDTGSDFTIEDFLSQTDLSQDTPIDYTTNDPLDLSINGETIKPPEWWGDNFNLNQHIKVEFNDHQFQDRSGLNTPRAASPTIDTDVNMNLNVGGHPWEESSGFTDIGEAFDVDNLFDLENIPSPQLA